MVEKKVNIFSAFPRWKLAGKLIPPRAECILSTERVGDDSIEPLTKFRVFEKSYRKKVYIVENVWRKYTYIFLFVCPVCKFGANLSRRS